MGSLLTSADIRFLTSQLGVHPTKTKGQNFVHDAGTVRKIVRAAHVAPSSRVLELGSGLGSLTLALLEAGAMVAAVDIDPRLAAALPAIVRVHQPDAGARLGVTHMDGLRLRGIGDIQLPQEWTADQQVEGAATRKAPDPDLVVSNLPYNVAVPLLLHTFDVFGGVKMAVVMVQDEVAHRIAASVGTKDYGVPSLKIAWFGRAQKVETVSRTVFWPQPHVDSALVRVTRYGDDEAWTMRGIDPAVVERLGEASVREATFAVIDAAFLQRRKTLRQSLARWAGSPADAERIVAEAGIDPRSRAESLELTDYSRLAVSRLAQAQPVGAGVPDKRGE
ncbi:MAG: 16S rRNA (adenine(1518)-N(6)/adenine(1519)-N(6))-dimethyltransferase RsmA [Actinomycetaceae bacterium]|nr:16S rRNA (adenine(1518)-N(6)/adenine(1519)-N(6))-dimethyltransferase RsmA [Actinomycetaceae bacterium]MDY6083538.1 16S rRNA (adenine(1518)-N(6)/adenine(1519)-N(6))-dimethyltransferase RsmA [Actinomycetaceae bacterium]